ATPAGVSESVILLVNGGFQAMLLTKFKTLGFSALTVGVLFAGALGLSGQAPAPHPTAAHTPTAAAPFQSVTVPVAYEEDVGETLTQMARSTRQKYIDGDLGGAAEMLRHIEETAARWRAKLIREQAERGPQVRERMLKAQLDKVNAELADLRAAGR